MLIILISDQRKFGLSRFLSKEFHVIEVFLTSSVMGHSKGLKKIRVIKEIVLLRFVVPLYYD